MQMCLQEMLQLPEKEMHEVVMHEAEVPEKEVPEKEVPEAEMHEKEMHEDGPTSLHDIPAAAVGSGSAMSGAPPPPPLSAAVGGGSGSGSDMSGARPPPLPLYAAAGGGSGNDGAEDVGRRVARFACNVLGLLVAEKVIDMQVRWGCAFFSKSYLVTPWVNMKSND